MATFFMTNLAFSNSARVGNGGGGLFCSDNRNFLLDYYEAEFNGTYTFNNLSGMTKDEMRETFFKRVSHYNSSMSHLLKEIETFFWKNRKLVPNANFKIPEDFRNIFYESNCKLKVVAVQRRPILKSEKTFFINKNLWLKMNEVSKQGLVFHEILYFIAINLEIENSRQVRQALAYVMSDQFKYDEADFREKFFNKVTGGFFSRIEPFMSLLCPRMNRYGFNCNFIR